MKRRKIAVGIDGLGEHSIPSLEQDCGLGGWRNDFRGMLFDNAACIFKTQHQGFSWGSGHGEMIDQDHAGSSNADLQAESRSSGNWIYQESAIALSHQFLAENSGIAGEG